MADYDGDGDLDCSSRPAARCRATGIDLLFRNPGHGRDWLNVEPVGHADDRAGIGQGNRVDFTTRSGSSCSVFGESAQHRD